ncbi:MULTISPECIES: hypothetical protein [Bradyrhizobium]|nr:MULTISPECIES: hypothetical protein [Bradyrhizobium]
MPNLFAYFALCIWPIVGLWLYLSRPITQATIWTFLGAYLLLPVGAVIKIEMIPQFDKSSIPNICGLIGCIFASPSSFRIWRKFGLVECLVVIYVLSPFITSSLNNDPIVVGDKVLPGVGNYDAVSASLSQLISILPLLIGRQLFRQAETTTLIFRALVVSGLLYSVPLLFEIRMSPQLHAWIYGIRPSEFLQGIRGGGYRPMAFLGHGLIASLFMMTTMVAGCALWRMRIKVFGLPAAGTTVYLAGILILCKSLGALVYGLISGPLVYFGSLRLQHRIAVLLVTVALTFPILRIVDIFPTTTLSGIFAGVSELRADSLQYRFDNEDKLLAHANERFWFGWGRFGRNRVYTEEGDDRTVTDGRWIITMGQFGFVGFLAEFLLLTLPVFLASVVSRSAMTVREALSLGALSLIVAMGVIDQLPNASVASWPWLLTGALLGRADLLRARGLSGAGLLAGKNPGQGRLAISNSLSNRKS